MLSAATIPEVLTAAKRAKVARAAAEAAAETGVKNFKDAARKIAEAKATTPEDSLSPEAAAEAAAGTAAKKATESKSLLCRIVALLVTGTKAPFQRANYAGEDT